MDNNINNNSVSTSSNFFYNNYSIKYFITLNRLILIKIAKNIVISINNNAFTYSLTSSIKASTEPSTARYSNDGNRSSNDKNKSITYLYNNYGIKYFITLNRLILIKIAKNIVMSINNNTFTYSLTSSIEASTEPSTVRRSNNGNRSSNNKDKNTTYLYNNNPPNFTVNINFLNCYFNDNR